MVFSFLYVTYVCLFNTWQEFGMRRWYILDLHHLFYHVTCHMMMLYRCHVSLCLKWHDLIICTAFSGQRDSPWSLFRKTATTTPKQRRKPWLFAVKKGLRYPVICMDYKKSLQGSPMKPIRIQWNFSYHPQSSTDSSPLSENGWFLRRSFDFFGAFRPVFPPGVIP